MKKIILFMMIPLILLSTVSAKPVCNEGPGAIWTTNNDCGNASQDVNHYASGDRVFINGDNFCPGDHNWTITGQPGNASCNPGIIAAGVYDVNESGAFCIDAYIVGPIDCGEYKVDFGKKNDNFRVEETTSVPEFTTIGAALALVGAGIYIYKKKQ